MLGMTSNLEDTGGGSGNGNGTKLRDRSDCWALVPAGGNGERMRGAVAEWFGSDRPKQFCAFTGTRTMLEHTADRAARIVGADHVVTVASAAHKVFMEDERHAALPGTVLFQPENRGTAAAIYLGLSHILARDRSAVVLILPSDHFIHPESAFISLARLTCDMVREDPGRIFILGAKADGPCRDYGWIRAGKREGERGARRVTGFYEKPPRELAECLHREGAMLSTMIITARASLLWELGARHLGDMIEGLDTVRRIERLHHRGLVPADHPPVAVRHAYRSIPSGDFSADILQRCARNCRVVPMQGIDWNDWGRPERVLETLERYGLEPAFEVGSGRAARFPSMRRDARGSAGGPLMAGQPYTRSAV